MLMPSIFGDSLFDEFFDDFYKPVKKTAEPAVNANSLMRTDVKESESAYTLEIDLPGYTKENVKVQLKDGYLTVSGDRKQEKDEKNAEGKYIRRERFAGTCSRTFYVGEDVTQEDIKAKFENGILLITVPKKEAKPEVEENKYITIE